MDDIIQQQTPVTINILKEQALIQKQIVEKGRVHIEKKVHYNEETIHIPVISEEVYVTKLSNTTTEEKNVILREEEIIVERLNADK